MKELGGGLKGTQVTLGTGANSSAEAASAVAGSACTRDARPPCAHFLAGLPQGGTRGPPGFEACRGWPGAPEPGKDQQLPAGPLTPPRAREFSGGA